MEQTRKARILLYNDLTSKRWYDAQFGVKRKRKRYYINIDRKTLEDAVENERKLFEKMFDAENPGAKNELSFNDYNSHLDDFIGTFDIDYLLLMGRRDIFPCAVANPESAKESLERELKKLQEQKVNVYIEPPAFTQRKKWKMKLRKSEELMHEAIKEVYGEDHISDWTRENRDNIFSKFD